MGLTEINRRQTLRWLAFGVATLLLPWTCWAADNVQSPASPAGKSDWEIQRREASAAMDRGQWAQAFLLLQRLRLQLPDDPSVAADLETVVVRLDGGTAARELIGPPWWRQIMPGLRPSAWLEAEVGHDSNINSATELASIRLPVANQKPYANDPLLMAQPSDFIGINGGFGLRYPTGPLALHVAGSGSARYNTDQYVYLPYDFGLVGGAEAALGPLRVGVDGVLTERWLARYHALDSRGVALRLGLPAVKGWRLQAATEAGHNRYAVLAEFETRYQQDRIAIVHDGSGLTAALLQGGEQSLTAIKDMDHAFTGYAVGWQGVLGPGRLRLQLISRHHRYAAESPIFLVKRQDRYDSISLEYDWPLGGQWFLTPRLASEKNVSNIELTRYTRQQYLLAIRREF